MFKKSKLNLAPVSSNGAMHSSKLRALVHLLAVLLLKSPASIELFERHRSKNWSWKKLETFYIEDKSKKLWTVDFDERVTEGGMPQWENITSVELRWQKVGWIRRNVSDLAAPICAWIQRERFAFYRQHARLPPEQCMLGSGWTVIDACVLQTLTLLWFLADFHKLQDLSA